MRFRNPIRFRTYGPELILDALEERIVLDASVAPAQDNHDNAANDHAAQQSGLATDPSGHNDAAGHADASSNPSQTTAALAAQVFNQDLKVVLISNALDQVDTIAQAAKDNAKVIVIDANKDTLITIEQSLENLVQATGQKIGTLAVVAHGKDGAVEIGADNIQLANFFKYESGLKSLANVLAEGAQIQFYGCSVAGDTAGQELLAKIAADTHANVFASLNDTGGTGNDWNLEYSTTPGIPMYVLLDEAKLGNFNEVLSFPGIWPLSDPNQYNTYWGSIDAGDPVGIDGRAAEFWTFSGTAGETVFIGMQSTRPDQLYGHALNIDTFLEIYNPDGTQAAQIDDWKSPPGDALNLPPYALYSDSLLQWKLPQTGTYVVQACTWYLGDYGDYSLIAAKENSAHVISPLDLTALPGNNIQNKVDWRPIPDVSVDNNFTNYTYDMGDFFGKPLGTTPNLSYSLGALGGTLGAGTYTCGIDPATGLITVTHTGLGSGTLTVPVTATDGTSTATDTFILTVNSGNAAPYVESGGLPNINVWPGDPLSKTIDLKTYFQDWEDGDNLIYNNPAPTVTNPNGVISSWSLDNVNKTLTLNYSSTGQGTATITVTGKDSGGSSVAETFTVTARLNEPALQNIGFETGNTTGWTIDATPVTVINSTGTDGFVTKMVRVDQDGGDANPAQLHQGFKWNGEKIQIGYDFFTYDGLGYDLFGYTISLNGTPIAYLNRDAGWSGNTGRNNALATTGWITDPVVDPAAFGAKIGDVIDITLFAGNDVTSGNYDSWAYFDLQLATTGQNPVSKGIADIEVIEDSSDSVLNLYNAFFDAQTSPANMTYRYTITNTDNTSLFAHVDGAAPPDNTPVTITNPSAFTLDYGPNQSGYATIKITATDTDSRSVDYTFKVTVRPANDFPTGGVDQFVVLEAGPSVYQDITLTGHDPEFFPAGEVKFVTNYAGTGTLVAQGALTSLGGGDYSQVWRYTPNANYYGAEIFQYSLSTPTGTWNGLQTGQGTEITKPNTTQDGTNDMQLADLNHDGYLDLVEANQQTTGAAYANYFFLNDGTGHFNAGVQMGNDTSQSVRLVLGDINNDGYVDAVVANSNNTSDYVYIWNPSQNKFNNGVALSGTNAYGTKAVALGDFNGDGWQDIVIATSQNPNNLIEFLNNGNGTFGTGKTLAAQSGAIGAIGVADMNGDGYVDIVVGKDGTADDLIYINNGAGSFASTSIVHLPSAGRGNTSYLTVGDVDGDHNVDVVMGGNGQNRLYKNNGGNSFSYFRIGSTDADNTTSIRLADLNRDGYLDVVAFNDVNGTTPQADKYYLYNTGTTNPYVANGTAIESAAIRDQAGVLGDINNDGNVDLIMGIYTTTNNSVTTVNDRILLNLGWKGFESGQGTTITKPHASRDGTNDMQLADLNHDGYLDLIEANQRQDNGAGYANYFFLNDGTGHFGAATQIGSDTSRSVRVVLGDVNGDGYLDAVVANTNNTLDYVYLWNSGTNTFNNGVTLTGTNAYSTTAVAIGDFNGDGRQDIAIATNEANGRVIIFQNPGSGNFTGVAGTAVGVTASGTIGALGVADMNRDGYVDIVVGKDATHDDMIYLNNGAGGFTNTVSLPTAGRGNTTYLALGDVDGDHNIDIVMGGNGQNRLYKNNGSGSFSYYRIGTTDAENTASIRLADLNNDGYLDVVAFNDFSGTTPQVDKYYLYNAGTLNPYQANGTAIESAAIGDRAGALGDINNDGNVDLIMGIYTTTNNPNVTNNYDRVFLNQGRGFEYSTVAQSADPAAINVQTELIKNSGFETGDLGVNAWKIDERTTEDDPTLLALVGIVPNNTTIDMMTNTNPPNPTSVKDLVNNDYPLQFWAWIGAQSGDPNSSITVYDPTGGAGDHILVSTDSGPRKDMIYQDVVIPNDPSVTQYTVTWRMAYWNLDFINNDPQFHTAAERQPQYIALYVYDPTKPIPSPVWTTIEGSSPDIVPQLQDYSVTITDPALRGTKVRIAIEVFSGDNFLQMAVDDFHIYPTRTITSTPSAGANPAANPPYFGQPVYLQPPPAMAMAAAFSSPDLEMMMTATSGPTIVPVLEGLSATGSSSLISVIEQQAAQTSTASTADQGTASSDQIQAASVNPTDSGDTGLVQTAQQTVVVPDTAQQATVQTVVPATQEAAPEVVVPPADQTPQPAAPADQTPPPPVEVLLAGGFDPDLNLNASMVFDPSNLSSMNVIALSAEMDTVHPATAELQHLAMKLAGGQSGAIDLDAVRFTEIFA